MLVFNPTREFFLDSVEDGFFISSMVKRYRAAQLEVLSEVDRVCEKYGIRWFADCGTLLGAVRHGGFIPWDDDIDICMLRPDYKRFFEVAVGELPEHYAVLSLDTDSDYDNYIGSVVNRRSIIYGDDNISKAYGCPYVAGIDIFPLDGIYRDSAREDARRNAILEISEAISLISEGKYKSPTFARLLSAIERRNHISIRRDANIMYDIMRLTERLYSECPAEEADFVALMPYWIEYGNHKYDKGFFNETVELNFENIKLNAPYRYEEVLGVEYGEFMRIYKHGGVHDYPGYKGQEERLIDALQANPYRYTMPRGHIEKRRVIKTSDRISDIFDTIIEAHSAFADIYRSCDAESFAKLLENCQNLAISAGTTIEDRLIGGEPIVKALEEYCELLYEASLEYNEETTVSGLDESIYRAQKIFASSMQTQKERIVIVAVRASWWKSLEPVWRALEDDPDNEVIVIAIPYAIKTFYGTDPEWLCDKDIFPEYLNILDAGEIDIAKLHPGKIFIQTPYDGSSMIFDVPSEYYSDVLLGKTDELVYVPCFVTDEPDEADDKIAIALKTIIEQPAVYYSDTILLRSDKLKETYVSFLCDITGDQNRKYWEDKIRVVRNHFNNADKGFKVSDRRLPYNWEETVANRKVLVFRVSASFLFQYGKAAVNKIREAISIIKGNSDRVICVFSPDDSISAEVGLISKYLLDWNITDEALRADWDVIYDDSGEIANYIDRIDAYYGSPGWLAYECTKKKIPVMIMTITE